jgi:heme exporter protein A
MIRTEKLVKTYQGKPVLRGLDFTLQPGELVVLQGANGAGKSTLIRILSTLTRPTAGDAFVGGFSVRQAPQEVRLQIGVMLHQPMLYADLTAMENLMFFADLAGMKNPKQVCRQSLEQVELDPGSQKQVRYFSRGMAQRLSLARAWLTDPAVLLLDEPFTGLDASHQEQLLALLVKAASNGKTVLVTDHNAARAVSMATRVDYLYQGKIALSFHGADLTLATVERGIQELEQDAASSMEKRV